MKCFV